MTALHVVAAVLSDEAGRILLAQRPAGKHLAGLWEFAGGKLEAGERPLDGLRREIEEELGLTVVQASPWLQLPWHYASTHLLLDVWKVAAWSGQPHGREGQAVAWYRPEQVDPAMLAGADRMVLRSLLLPPKYPITAAGWEPSDTALVEQQLRHWLHQGQRMMQLRLPLWSPLEVRAVAARLQAEVVAADACLLLNGDVDGARRLGAGIGVHLTGRDLGIHSQRPLPLGQRVGVSCHDGAQLARAVAIDADFATLSPVLATPSHPGAAGIGWSVFASEVAAAALPVYALGGVSSADLAHALAHGAQGIAGIRGFSV